MHKGWDPIIWLYKALMLLYPRRFRTEFGPEMQMVFSEALGDAAVEGFTSQVRALLREFVNMPFEAIRQHLKIENNRFAWIGPASRGEVLVTLMFFILPTTYLFLNSYLGATANLIWILIGFVILAVIVTGFIKGFPRWSLPYLGLALSLVSFLFVFQWIADLVTVPMLSKFGPIPHDEGTRLLLQAFWAGLLWLSLLTFTLLVFGFLALVKRFDSLLDCIRKDWTLASYLLYYGATFTLFLAYDQYRGDRPFMFASAICLASGAWFYLHGSNAWQRILALLSGLSLAMLAAFAARWSFIPGSEAVTWPLVLVLDPRRWSSAIWTVFDWGWIFLILMAPVLLRLFKNDRRRTLLRW